VSPWIIIGWCIVGIGALVAGLLGLFIWDTYVQPWLVGYAQHIRTRKVQPQPWQVWMQGKTALTITRIAENGRICLTTALVFNGRRHGNGASWSDSPEEWRERVKARRLWLLKDEPVERSEA
jgi:hypothetical protein